MFELNDYGGIVALGAMFGTAYYLKKRVDKYWGLDETKEKTMADTIRDLNQARVNESFRHRNVVRPAFGTKGKVSKKTGFAIVGDEEYVGNVNSNKNKKRKKRK